MTTYIDIIFDHHKLNREHFIESMNNAGFDVNKKDLEALDEKLHASMFYSDNMFRIDFKGVYTELEQSSIDMAISIQYKGISINLDHPSNMIVHKIYFGSEQDIEDAVAVYIRNKDILDVHYMSEKAGKLGVLNEFQQFLENMNKVNLDN